METRKTELLNFLKYLQLCKYVGIYYVDKTMGIVHYSVYSNENIDVLREKLKTFNDSLDDDMLKILLWKVSDSKEYLTGVYDGLVNDFANDGGDQ